MTYPSNATARFQVLFYLLFLLSAWGVQAQNFPVRASVTLVNPSPYLEDYAKQSNLIITLTLVDDQPEYEGYLRLNLSGDGYQATSRREASGLPITLRRGRPLILRGAALIPYFDLNNLEFSGLGGADRTTGGILPDGPITICAEFFDLNRIDAPSVANPACATRFIQQNYPPELIAPTELINPLPAINFRWAPRHFPIPGQEEYRLEIREILPGLTYDQVINSQPLVRPAISSRMTNHVFTNYDNILQKGHDYLWRVQIQDTRNARRFINNGFSDYGVFTYGEAPVICPGIERFFTESSQAREVELRWATSNNESLDHLEIRAQSVNASGWEPTVSIPANSENHLFSDLIAGTDYLAELCLVCSDGSRECRTLAFSTLSVQDDCGPLSSPVAEPLSATELSLTWPSIPQARGFVLSWEALPETTESEGSQGRPNRGNLPEEPTENPASSNGARTGAPSPNAPLSDSLSLPALSTSAVIGNLSSGTEYRLEFCKLCPNGSRECFDWNLFFSGRNEDCLDELLIAYTDSSSTSRTLAWPVQFSFQVDSFSLYWQTSDQSAPEHSARVATRAGTYTIRGLQPDKGYTARYCASCSPLQIVCRNLPSFGGCPASYKPELLALSPPNALLGFHKDGNDTITTEWRYGMRAFSNWRPMRPGEIPAFSATEFNLPPRQLAQAENLTQNTVYLAQLRNVCRDSSWSEWSPPLAFSPSCRLADIPVVVSHTDTSAILTMRQHGNAEFYSYSYRRLAEREWTDISPSTTPEAHLGGLLPDTDYLVRVRYWCTLGAWSDYSPEIPLQTYPACEPPTAILVSDRLASSATINWTPPDNGQQSQLEYRLRYQVQNQQQSSHGPANNNNANEEGGGGSNNGPIPLNTPWTLLTVDAASQALSNLSPGGGYEFRLRSDCGVLQSSWTPIDTFALDCAPPSNLLVDQITYESARVAFSGLSPAATHHEVAFRKLGERDWFIRPTGTPQRNLLGLDDLATYEVRVRSRCAANQFSDWSPITQFQTLVKCLTPTELGLVSLQSDRAGVRWDVTGTVSEWEVRWIDVQLASQMASQQQQNQSHTANGQTNNPEEGGGGNAPNPNLTFENEGEQRGGGGTNNFDPNSETAGGADPYAGWAVRTTTDPHLLFTSLGADRSYRMVVRAQCPTFGYTDYSEVLSFRTLCAPATTDTLLVDQIMETDARLSWPAVATCQTGYQVVVAGPERTTIHHNNSSSSAGGGPDAPNDYFESFVEPFRDTLFAGGETIQLNNLRANETYQIKVRPQLVKGAFSAGSDNYLTMAEWNMGAGAGAEIVGTAGWGPFSQEISFKTDHCAQPYAITETILTRSSVELSWVASSGENTYDVRFKPHDDPASAWQTVRTNESLLVLGDLRNETLYDYQVTEVCKSGGIRPAPQDTFLLGRPSLNNGFYVCGVNTNVDLSNQVPLVELKRGDTIRVFDFPVVITQSSGADGYFSGAGDIRVPYFNKAKMQFTFDSIFVNDDYQMAAGYLLASGFGVEVLTPRMDALLDRIIGYLERAEEYLTQQQLDRLQELVDLRENNNLPASLQDRITGVIDCFDDANTTAARDSCETELVQVMASVDSFLNLVYDGNFQVNFVEDPEQTYGFDAKRSGDPASWYEKKTISGQDYFVSYKSALAGVTEKVRADVPSGKKDSVAFSQVSTDAMPVTYTGDQAKINFSAQPGDPYYLVAKQPNLAPPRIVGMTEVLPFEELPLKVVLVPVGFAPQVDIAAIESGLEAIYRQAVVAPEVRLEPPFYPSNYDGSMDSVASGLLSNYSREMRDIIRDFKDDRNRQEDEFYLFLINSYTPTSLKGFMPPGRQYGFIFEGNAGSGPAYVRTLAHELGHGAFVLEHTWDAHPSLAQGSTDNLMDYGSGTKLHKWQWELIHDPASKPLLPGDDQSAYQGLNQMAQLDNFRNPDGSLTFVSPAGKPITLPADVRAIRFNTGDNVKVAADCYQGFGVYPFGSLRSFTLANGEVYYSYIQCNKTANFLEYRYFEDETTYTSYIDTLSNDVPTQDRKAVFALPNVVNGAAGWEAFSANWSELETADWTLNYRANGSRVKYDYLLDVNRSGAATLVLEDHDQLTASASLLLDIAASWPYATPATLTYAYTHAHQMSRYPGLDTLCAFRDITGVDYEALNDKLNGIYANIAEPASGILSYSSTGPPTQFQNTSTDIPSIMEKAEIEGWEAADESIYQQYNDFYQQNIATHQSVLSYPDNLTGANGLIQLLDAWRHMPCAFGELSLAERIHILKVLRHADLNNQWLWGLFGEEQEGLYNGILMLTKESEYQAVLNIFMENDYALFSIIHDKFGEVGYDFFVGALSRMVIAQNPLSFDDWGVEYFADDNGSYSQRRGRVYNPNAPQDGLDVPVHVIDPSVNNPSVYFASSIVNGPNGFEYRLLTGNNSTEQGRNGQAGGPFGMVILYFPQDVTFGNDSPLPIDVKAGKSILVPICLAELLFRYYRDANWDRNFKTLIAVVAVAAAVVATVTTGGTAGGVLIAVLANIDAGAKVAQYALADDAYSYATTGSGTMSQEIHDAVDQISKVTGYMNMAGGMGVAAGRKLFNLGSIKTTYESAKGMSNINTPALLRSFKRLKLVMGLYKGYNAQDRKYQKVLQHLQAQLTGLALNDAATINDQQASLHLNAGQHPIVLKNDQSIVLGSGSYDSNDTYHITPLVWAGADTLSEPKMVLDRVSYYNQNNEASFGQLAFYQDAQDPLNWKTSATPSPYTDAADYPDLIRLFQEKNWDWNANFTPQVKALVDQLDPENRQALITALGGWATGQTGESALPVLLNDVLNDIPFGIAVKENPDLLQGWYILYADALPAHPAIRKNVTSLKALSRATSNFIYDSKIGWPALQAAFGVIDTFFYPGMIQTLEEANTFFTKDQQLQLTLNTTSGNSPSIEVVGVSNWSPDPKQIVNTTISNLIASNPDSTLAFNLNASMRSMLSWYVDEFYHLYYDATQVPPPVLLGSNLQAANPFISNIDQKGILDIYLDGEYFNNSWFEIKSRPDGQTGMVPLHLSLHQVAASIKHLSAYQDAKVIRLYVTGSGGREIGELLDRPVITSDDGYLRQGDGSLSYPDSTPFLWIRIK